MKTFEHEWILETFDDHPTFYTKGMFGGLAVYLFERQMMLLVEPTKSGRWNWHGILLCTEFEHQESLMKEFPRLKPHDILRKWLFLPSSEDDFETIIQDISKRMLNNDLRFGIHPKPRSRSRKSVKKGRKTS